MTPMDSPQRVPDCIGSESGDLGTLSGTRGRVVSTAALESWRFDPDHVGGGEHHGVFGSIDSQGLREQAEGESG